MYDVIRAHATLTLKALLNQGALFSSTRFLVTLPGKGADLRVKYDKDSMSLTVAGKELAQISIADPDFESKLTSIIERNRSTGCSHLHAYNSILEYGEKEELLAVIANDKELAYFYARDVLKGPFPAGEAAIAKDAAYAYLYAKKALKGPFPAGEAAIAKDADYAFWYAREVLKLSDKDARSWRRKKEKEDARASTNAHN